MRLWIYSFCPKHREQRLLKLCNFQLQLNSSVIALKHMLCEAFEVTYFEQRLTFAAQELHDSKSLGDYRGLKEDSTLHLFPVQLSYEEDPPLPQEPTAEERLKLQQEADDLRIAKELAQQLADSSSDES